MRINIIWAQDPNGIIGLNGKIPWHISDDLQRFKEITKGHAVIMGRRTWESLPVKPLPGRKNIIVSSNLDFIFSNANRGAGTMVCSDFPTAIRNCEEYGFEEAFVIGGRRLFKEALPIADQLLITEVYKPVRYFDFDDVVRLPETQEGRGRFWRLDYIQHFEDHSFYIEVPA